MFCLKIDLLRDLAAGVHLSEAPSPPRFLFGLGKAILQVRNLVKYTLSNSCICSPHNPIPPTVTIFHRRVENTNMSDCIYSL
jgi:hypothetical protein